MIEQLRVGMRKVSDTVANGLSHPISMLAVLGMCAGWMLLGGSEEALGSALSIAAFIATLMVLNQQRRRDRALHLKIDELILSKSGARDEMAGIEHATEEEMAALAAGHDPLTADSDPSASSDR